MTETGVVETRVEPVHRFAVLKVTHTGAFSLAHTESIAILLVSLKSNLFAI